MEKQSKIKYRVLDFLGHPGYRIGSDGKVWSRMGHSGRGTGLGSKSHMNAPWKVISPQTTGKYGHVSVHLHKNGKVKAFAVHRLVLEAFVGPRPEGMECRHLDGDPTNNRLENLRWGTHKENERDKIRHGTNVGNRGNVRGEVNGNARLVADDVIKIREMYATGNYTQSNLSSLFGVQQGSVSSIIRGKTWGHVGGPVTKIGRIGGDPRTRGDRVRGAYANLRD